MKPEYQREIEKLRTEHKNIRGLVDGRGLRIRELSQRMESEIEPARPAATHAGASRKIIQPEQREQPPASQSPASTSGAHPADAHASQPKRPAPQPRTNTTHSAPGGDSIEIELGRYWLVRIGIIILLTGLVFLGNLAYQHIVPMLGAGGKLALIAGAGAALCTVGVWIASRRERMRGYARVLIAGGSATIYYAAYAAHHVATLRVIESPLAGGLLLLALAGGFVFFAHRRKSEALALPAIILAYYTSGITAAGGFTLFSSLLLTAAGVFFLLHHRWTKLAFATLAGTYASYAWWRFTGVAPAMHESLLPVWFLAGYWALFTAGAFLARHDAVPAASRASFATLNNGAFFALATHCFLSAHSAGFWKFALSLGALLLVLARFAAHRWPEDRAFDGALLVQGLALAAVGLAAKLTGTQLALTCAASSIVLLRGQKRHRTIREGAGFVAAASAFVLAAEGFLISRPTAPATSGIVAVALIFDAWWWKRGRSRAQVVQPAAIVLVAMGALLGASCALDFAGWRHAVMWIAAASGVLALPVWRRWLRELPLVMQFALPVAALSWVFTTVWVPPAPAAIIVAGVALALAWARQREGLAPSWPAVASEGLAAFTAVAIGAIWLSREFGPGPCMALAAAAALAWSGAAMVARSGMLALSGLVFSALACGAFLVLQKDTAWWCALAVPTHLVAWHFLALAFPRTGTAGIPPREWLRTVAIPLAAAMIGIWAFHHIPAQWLALFFSTLGAVLVLAAQGRAGISAAALICSVLAGGVFLVKMLAAPHWQNLLALLVFPAACRIARRASHNTVLDEAAPPIAWSVMICTAAWVMRFTATHHPSVSLTVVWSLLATTCFLAGIALHERHYRLGGLALLGLCVARVFIVDVWRLDPVYRIFSFITLGLALLLVGYFYNRYEEKIRRWL